ncbi:MAG: type II secretion system protein M [Proteobacteria bacterium]|nr:type II secretion system protein M [Pseudomonadota bacterium]MBU4035405.1 type II secretion system protein M [Pseudomonadota bacterium]
MRKSKLLIIVVPFTFILLSLFIYEYGYLTIRAKRIETDEMLLFKTKVLRKYMTMIARKPQLENRLDSLKEIRNTENEKIIKGQTIPLAAAAMQDAVKGIIINSGGIIFSERVENPEDFNSFKIISITMDMSMPDARALSDTIYAIETHSPFLVIKEFEARVKNYNKPKDLIVKLKVSAITGAR